MQSDYAAFVGFAITQLKGVDLIGRWAVSAL